MSSTNKTSLGLNLWEASDKPVRQDFVNDNTIIDEKITNIKSSMDYVNSNLDNVNSNLIEVSTNLSAANTNIASNTLDIEPLKSNYVPDINNNTIGKVNIVTWDTSTESTPYKTGDTTYGNGFCITFSLAGDLWLCQFAMAVGDSHFFTRNRNNGVWSGWTVK